MSKPTHALVALGLAFSVLGCEREQPPAPKSVQSVPGASSAQTPAPSSGGMANAPQFAPNPVPVATANGQISIAGVAFNVPDGWKQVPPANQMRLAELSVPDPSGDAAKACTVVFTSAGGDVESNITRWANQMKDAGGNAPTAKPVKREIGGLTVHTVELAGAFQGMGEAPKSDWMLRGAIIESPAGLVFVKMTGPQATMKSASAGWSGMIDSIKKQ